ncbi:hypothetical protein ACFYKX_11315 [Cytobacillus sp. FJAT-54145]|uniref:Uncharacterized protein n=1 Tax=Cytobacillus spartinae TaxID=3299023 RepID=A0ABW6KBS9_9BACI
MIDPLFDSYFQYQMNGGTKSLKEFGLPKSARKKYSYLKSRSYIKEHFDLKNSLIGGYPKGITLLQWVAPRNVLFAVKHVMKQEHEHLVHMIQTDPKPIPTSTLEYLLHQKLLMHVLKDELSPKEIQRIERFLKKQIQKTLEQIPSEKIATS